MTIEVYCTVMFILLDCLLNKCYVFRTPLNFYQMAAVKYVSTSIITFPRRNSWLNFHYKSLMFRYPGYTLHLCFYHRLRNALNILIKSIFDLVLLLTLQLYLTAKLLGRGLYRGKLSRGGVNQQNLVNRTSNLLCKS